MLLRTIGTLALVEFQGAMASTHSFGFKFCLHRLGCLRITVLIDSVDPIACTQYILHTLTPEGESVKQSKRYVANSCFFLATTGLDKLTSKVTHE